MRMALRLAVMCLAVMLSASAAQAQWWSSFRGNDTGGIIPWSCENEAAAQEWAAAHCARYSKYHRITSVTRGYGNYIGFNCLWRQDIARFILPAVRTRTLAACMAHETRPGPAVRVRY